MTRQQQKQQKVEGPKPQKPPFFFSPDWPCCCCCSIPPFPSLACFCFCFCFDFCCFIAFFCFFCACFFLSVPMNGSSTSSPDQSRSPTSSSISGSVSVAQASDSMIGADEASFFKSASYSSGEKPSNDVPSFTFIFTSPSCCRRSSSCFRRSIKFLALPRLPPSASSLRFSIRVRTFFGFAGLVFVVSGSGSLGAPILGSHGTKSFSGTA
mmetsp:Transcript_42586/g.96398  ORF Transcript_42586/g.96398 Transcript_42586/m.96398 type:complete len:210 (+) Transcript_42586:917-1546(+)